MPTVCHLLDQHCGWEQLRGAQLLQSRAAVDGWQHIPVGMSRRLQPTLNERLSGASTIRGGSGWPLFDAVMLSRHMRQASPDICHAWSIDAAHAAGIAGMPRILLTLANPHDVVLHAKRLRTLQQSANLSIVSTSETTLRRLVEKGLDPERIVLIRPGVDFAEINRVKKSNLRDRLGVKREDKLIVLGDTIRRKDALKDSFWALKLLGYLNGGYYGVIPRSGPENARIHRWESKLLGYHTLLQPPRDATFEALVSVADYFVLASRTEVSTTGIAWAMAAETLVIAPARYGVAEIIGSGLNGLLYKQPTETTQATEIVKCIHRDGQAKLREVARGHAFEVFAAQKSVDQYLILYDNILNGRKLDEGVTDTALAS